MSSWVIVVIVAIVMSGLVKIYSAQRDERLGVIRDEDGNPVSLSNRDDPEARRELEELRDRIKVLERIATDGNSLDARETRRISQEIEALRDKQNS